MHRTGGRTLAGTGDGCRRRRARRAQVHRLLHRQEPQPEYARGLWRGGARVLRVARGP